MSEGEGQGPRASSKEAAALVDSATVMGRLLLPPALHALFMLSLTASAHGTVSDRPSILLMFPVRGGHSESPLAWTVDSLAPRTPPQCPTAAACTGFLREQLTERRPGCCIDRMSYVTTGEARAITRTTRVPSCRCACRILMRWQSEAYGSREPLYPRQCVRRAGPASLVAVSMTQLDRVEMEHPLLRPMTAILTWNRFRHSTSSCRSRRDPRVVVH